MKIPLFCVSALHLLLANLWADSENKPMLFGPYEAIVFNKKILRDAKVDKEGNVFLQLFPEHKEKQLVVRISNEWHAGYRVWWNGSLDLVSPANAGKQPYGWTDRVQVQAKYIEYWMDGEIFLHLKRYDR